MLDKKKASQTCCVICRASPTVEKEKIKSTGKLLRYLTGLSYQYAFDGDVWGTHAYILAVVKYCKN